jgi:hypothetical protein
MKVLRPLLFHLDFSTNLNFRFPYVPRNNCSDTIFCDDPIFFFFKKKKRKMSHHSGTATCHSANIWYTFHNMYLIIRVTFMQRITHNNIINVAEGTSIDNS